MRPTRTVTAGLLAAACAAAAPAYKAPRPGSPEALTDWRWVARPLVGTRHVATDPWGKRTLRAVDGGYRVLDVPGPGVLDHLWTTIRAGTHLTIHVDGKRLWRGPFGMPKGNGAGLFPEPVCFQEGGMVHLLAPVAFRSRLRLTVDKPAFPHYASYRTLPTGSPVVVADGRANGLKRAAALWKKGAYGIHARPVAPAREVTRPFVLPAGGRAVALERSGSGEVVALELHMLPALTGTLRQVVVECTYDGAPAPALRLPITDLVGATHPWPGGRWDGYNGNLVAGLRYPWYEFRPRYYFPQATFHLNLPMPFAGGIRIELVNRSTRTQFAGHTRAVLQPLGRKDAAEAGRLCGTRTHAALRTGNEPLPLLRLPGRGHVVGLGLFVTGNSRWPAAITEGVVSLGMDDAPPITGHGLVPLWFQGVFGGRVCNTVIWNHPRFEDGFAGVMRHFLTDPIPFREQAVFGYTPGPTAAGAPTEATAVALWYRFDRKPYAAPALPDQAEALPHRVFPFRPARLGPDRAAARLVWAAEAEDLAPMATVQGGEIRVVQDGPHDFHPSAGRFLHLMADRPGDRVDVAVRLPHARYLSVGTYAVWGPVRGRFDLDVLSRDDARRAVVSRGYVPGVATIFHGSGQSRRTDGSAGHLPPMRNPAPDRTGVLRIVCTGKPPDSSAHLLKLDRIRLDVPPPTKPGWHEVEEMPGPQTSGELTAWLPKYGRFDWSGWGALVLSSPPGGSAVLTGLVPTGPLRPTRVRLRGCLGPNQGGWQARLAGGKEPVVLKPGKDANQVVEWTLPAAGLKLPGVVAVELVCTQLGKGTGRDARPTKARLALDAFLLE